MITRKTKLFTGLVAVVMLISMFAMFAMPAAAETEIDVSKLPKASEIASYPNVMGYVVADLEDFTFVSKNATKFTADKTLYITEDIDVGEKVLSWSGVAASIDGMNSTITGLNVTCSAKGDSWLGLYTGKFIRNITFKGGKVTGLSNDGGNCAESYLATIAGDEFTGSNITLDEITGVGATKSGESYHTTLLFGTNNANAAITLNDITIKNSVLDCSPLAKPYDVSFVIGQHLSKSVTIDGLTLLNNKMLGVNAMPKYQAFVFEQTNKGNHSLKNAAIIGNQVTGTAAESVYVISERVSGSVSAENIIAVGNTAMVETTPVAMSTLAQTAQISRVYTDAAYISGTTANSNVVAAADVLSGEALYDINIALANSGDETLTQWAIKDGAVVAADAENAAPVKVNFIVDGVRTNYYTDVDGKLIGINQDILDAQEWDQDVTLDTKFTKNTTIGVAGAALVTADLQEAVNYYDARDVDYFADNANLIAAKEAAEAILDGSSATAKQQDVDDLTDTLDSYVGKYASGKNAPPAADYALYPGATAYSVHDLADYEYVSANASKFAQGMTLYIAENIDVAAAAKQTWSGVQANIDGLGHTLSNITVENRWLGNYYKASFIKNITFKKCTATKAGALQPFLFAYADNTLGMTMENIVMDECSATVPAATSGLYQRSLMIGYNNGILNVKDVTIKNSSLTALTNNNSVALFIAQNPNDATRVLNVDGLYIYDNTIRNINNAAVGYVIGQAQGTVNLKNIVVAGNAILRADGTTNTSSGLVYGYEYAAASLYNLITYDNESGSNNAGSGNGSGKSELINKNVNVDTPDAILAINEAIAASDIEGLRAWGYEEDAENGNAITGVYGKNVGLLPITVKVERADYENAEIEKVFYTNSKGKLIGLTEEFKNLCADWSLALDGSFAEAVEVTGTHSCVMPEDWSYDAETFEHYKVCENTACAYRYAEKCAGETTKPAEPIGPDSKHTVVCATCGETSVVPCLFEEDTSRYEAATCEKGEVRWYVCALDACGVEYKTVGEPNQHNREEKPTHNGAENRADSYHYYKCNNENCDDPIGERIACTWGAVATPSTCTKDGYITYTCLTCEAVYVETNQDDLAHHRYGSWYRTKAPTATNPGEKRADCLYCNAYTTDVIPAYGDTAAFAVETDVPSIEAGENAVVYVKLENDTNANGVAGITFQVTYDNENLKLVTIENGGLFQSVTTLGEDGNPIRVEDVANGTVTISVASLQKVTTDGTVVKLTFTTEEDAKDGIYGINVVDTDNSVDGKGEYDPADMIEILDGVGTVTILNAIPGDVTMDGEVTIKDAVALTQYLAGMVPADKKVNTRVIDFNGDGLENTSDITALLKYLNDKAAS